MSNESDKADIEEDPMLNRELNDVTDILHTGNDIESDVIHILNPTMQKEINNLDMNDSGTTDNDYEMAYTNIGLRLKHYDNIFNIFDARPYTQRDLSLDFLQQVQERVKKTVEGDAEEVFVLIPSSIQNDEIEDVVRNRVRLHYTLQYEEFKQDAIKRQMWNVMWMMIGFFGIGFTTWLGLRYGDTLGDWFKVMIAMFEVTSWFVIWTYLEALQTLRRRNILDMKRRKLKAGIHIHFKKTLG